MVKNPPAVQETWLQALTWEDPGEGNGYPLQYSGLEKSVDRGTWQVNSLWGHKELEMTERLSLHFTSLHKHNFYMRWKTKNFMSLSLIVVV